MTFQTTWPEARTERVAELWNLGRTGGEIAAAVGITRSAALGKLHPVARVRRKADEDAA